MRLEPLDRQPGETPGSHKRFLFWFDLGDDRSFLRVAQEFGVTRNAVYRLALQNAWEDRLAEHVRGNPHLQTLATVAPVSDAQMGEVAEARDLLLGKILERVRALDAEEIPAVALSSMLKDLT